MVTLCEHSVPLLSFAFSSSDVSANSEELVSLARSPERLHWLCWLCVCSQYRLYLNDWDRTHYRTVVANTFFYPISFSLPLLSKRGLACPPQMQYKQFPFAGCTIAFLGFTEEEEDHMKDIATKTGEWQWRRRVVLQYVGPCEVFRTNSSEP